MGLAPRRPPAARTGARPCRRRPPSEDEAAGWSEYTDVVVEAIGDRSEVVVVGHSLGGFTAPLVCERLRVHRWTSEGYLVVLNAHRGQRVRAEPFEAIELYVGVLFGDDEGVEGP